MPDSAAVLSNISKSYGRQPAVDGINLELHSGEVLGLIGPNGAGKTTIVRVMLGLVRPTKGDVLILGQRLTWWDRSILRRVGSLVDRPAFYRHLSGADNLRILGPASGRSGKAEVQRLIGLTGLEVAGAKRVGRYSMGMAQRLAIALCLLGDPDVVILDEPTNGLDPNGIHWIRGLLKQLARDGKAILVTSHQLSEVEQVCGRVALINRGHIVRTGTLAAVLPTRELLVLFVSDPTAALRAIADDSWAAGACVDGDAVLLTNGPDVAEVARQRLNEVGHPVLRTELRISTHEEAFAVLTAGES